ncbi:MAG: putative ABC transporter permease [Patescibacteria group bacterium]
MYLNYLIYKQMIISKTLIIFLSGVVVGLVAEFLFRMFWSKKISKLSPASLWMYGFTAVFLYFINILNIHLVFKFLLTIVFTTSIEFITGWYLLCFKHKRLWNYSKHKWNYKGIICPLFSFFWLLVAIFYYYLIFPLFV